MNYLAFGIPNPLKRGEALGGFKEGPLMFYLDRDPAVLEVPVMESGRYPDMSMTDIRDVGLFVVAMLEVGVEWGGSEIGISSDTRNLGEVVDVVKRVVKGKEVVVKEVSMEELQERLDALDEGDLLGRMEVQYMMACARGEAVAQGVHELLPVKGTTFEEFMEKYWAV